MSFLGGSSLHLHLRTATYEEEEGRKEGRMMCVKQLWRSEGDALQGEDEGSLSQGCSGGPGEEGKDLGHL